MRKPVASLVGVADTKLDKLLTTRTDGPCRPQAGPREQVEANVLRLARAAVAEALAAAGRRQLMTAGIGTEVNGVAPALHAHRDGYQVTCVADACGSATALGHDISLRRMEQEGVALTTTASVVAELTGDYPKHAQIMRG